MLYLLILYTTSYLKSRIKVPSVEHILIKNLLTSAYDGIIMAA
uniref:Uncharacterized protein n=1 Tax=Siphoviridae sp. ct91l7 TaxID=2826173 RepID=A0A8S5MWN9_9CAUD|nr:MAG TPA: hypothetical protein [Siphoviridae sp. ct91l7]